MASNHRVGVLRLKGATDKEIITIPPPTTKECIIPSVLVEPSHQRHKSASPGCQSKHKTSCSHKLQQKASCTWNDELLKKCPGKGGTKISWRPGSGRHVSEGPSSYKLFTHISRTLHLEDALDVCTRWRMEPKNVTSFSCIDSRVLPPDHPCSNLRVLWFGAKFPDQDEDEPDWYGNVQFSVDAKILLENWKFFFLVEMMTTPTHTCSRILVTNTDYSDVLPPYDYNRAGGPWQVTPEGQLALTNCSRFRFRGTNFHQHVLEFMIDVAPAVERKMLQNCELSFRNHEEAQNMKIRHVCNRYQRAGTPCPTPFPRSLAATHFFTRLQMLNVCWNTGIPRLSESGRKCLQQHLQEIHMQMLSTHLEQFNIVVGNFN